MTAKTKTTKPPPASLLAAFKALEASSQIVVLLADEDGFDAATLRVLGAWQSTTHVWIEPKKPCPSQLPNAEAWGWLRSGMEIDLEAVAAAAGVTKATAREKLDVLIGNRLAYPDGTINKFATAAMKQLVVSRLKLKKKSKKKADDDDDEGDGDGATN